MLGQAPGTVVAAAFAVFNPEVVIPLVEEGWKRTDAATIWAAREAGAVAQLQRIIGHDPAGAAELADCLLAAAEPLPLSGRALFAGQLALPLPDDPVARLWRATDVLREARGDAHIIAWTCEGRSPIEVGLLGDLYWGLAPRAHTGGRGWSEEQLSEAEDRLRSDGLLTGDALTTDGFDLRERIEARTDDLMGPAIRQLGEELGAIADRLDPWGASIEAAGGNLSPAFRFTFG